MNLQDKMLKNISFVEADEFNGDISKTATDAHMEAYSKSGMEAQMNDKAVGAWVVGKMTGVAKAAWTKASIQVDSISSFIVSIRDRLISGLMAVVSSIMALTGSSWFEVKAKKDFDKYQIPQPIDTKKKI